MRRHLICASVIGLVGAVGCNRQSTQPGTVTPPLFGMAGSVSSKFDPTTIPQQPVMPTAVVRESSRKAAAPLRPETEVALADNAVEDAFQETYGDPQVGTRKPTAQDEGREMRAKYSQAERDRLIDGARQRYQRALATDPTHKGAMLGLARLYAYTGDKDRAIQAYQSAVQAHPQDHGLACKLAGVQIQFGDFAGAEGSARYALSLDPQNRTYQKVLGLALGHQAKWQEAGETLLAAGMPEADAHYFLARVRLDRGDAEGGRKQLQLSLSINPQHEAAKSVAAQLDAGRPVPAFAPQNPVVNVGYAEPQR